VGPGRTLNNIAGRHPQKKPEHSILSSLPHPKESVADEAFLLETLGRIWLAGGQPDWPRFYEGEKRLRVPLPTYPFERQSYWVDPPKMRTLVDTAPLPEDEPDPEIKTMPARKDAPRDETEQVVLEIFRQILGLPDMGIFDHFFESGGNSLLATRVGSRIRERFHMVLTIRQIFEDPTASGIAEMIRAGSSIAAGEKRIEGEI